MRTIVSVLVLLIFSLGSCKDGKDSTINVSSEVKNNRQYETECLAKMEEHLNAVSNRDLITLKSTLAPSGDMLLILPRTETIVGVDAFMVYHKAWFASPDWTFTTTIIDSYVSEDMAFVIV